MKIYRFLSLSISLFRIQKVSGSEVNKINFIYYYIFMLFQCIYFIKEIFIVFKYLER